MSKPRLCLAALTSPRLGNYQSAPHFLIFKQIRQQNPDVLAHHRARCGPRTLETHLSEAVLAVRL